MGAVAEMVTVLGAEMLSLQRQRDDFLRMVHDGNAREERLRDELAGVRAAAADSHAALQHEAVLTDHLNAVRLKRDEWCKKVRMKGSMCGSQLD
jgi:heme exporter protein D